jgi:hypothetical protein
VTIHKRHCRCSNSYEDSNKYVTGPRVVGNSERAAREKPRYYRFYHEVQGNKSASLTEKYKILIFAEKTAFVIPICYRMWLSLKACSFSQQQSNQRDPARHSDGNASYYGL